MSNGLDPDQDRHSVGPDLGPNCLQRLSADDKSRCKRGQVMRDPALCFYDQLAELHSLVMTVHTVFAANNSDSKQTASGFHCMDLAQNGVDNNAKLKKKLK